MAFRLLSIAALLSTALAAPVEKRAGGPLLVFGARGSNQPQGLGSLSEITDLIQTYAADARISAVTYPATLDNYWGSVQAGVSDLQGQLISALNAQPDARVALIGYSQGANVVMDAICGCTEAGNPNTPLPAQYHDNIRSIILMGDPTHYSAQTFVHPSKATNGMIPRVNNFDCAPFNDRIISYCNDGDPVCASGGDDNAHTTYNSLFKVNAAWMTLARLWA